MYRDNGEKKKLLEEAVLVPRDRATVCGFGSNLLASGLCRQSCWGPKNLDLAVGKYDCNCDVIKADEMSGFRQIRGVPWTAKETNDWVYQKKPVRAKNSLLATDKTNKLYDSLDTSREKMETAAIHVK